MSPDELRKYFEEASRRTGVPVAVLMAQARQESGLNPNAVGKAGEIGLTQIMPSTARDPGFGLKGVDPAALRDPATNALFGAQYLAARAKAAGVTDWNNPEQVAKALKAYNGGGDPNYAQHVMRFMPGGSQGSTVNYAASKSGMDSPRERLAQANPASAPPEDPFTKIGDAPRTGIAGLLDDAGVTKDKLDASKGLLDYVTKQQADQTAAANAQTQMLWAMAAKGAGPTQPTMPFNGFKNVFANGLLG